MTSSSKRVWVGSVVLSSALLLSTLQGVHMPGDVSESTSSLSAAFKKNSREYSALEIRTKMIASASRAEIKRTLAAQAVAEARKAEEAKVASLKVAAENEAKAATQKAEAVKTSQQTVQVASILSSSEVSRGGTDDSSVIVQNAQSLIGVPYVFGGTSIKGFDCSGLTQYVYKGSGIKLPRTSYAQFGVGTAISKDQLNPGDLVFFATYDKGASHVGIYIGAGSFIHASNSGVKVTSLSDSYYAPRYLGARRVL